MARERISLVPDEVKREQVLKQQLLDGEMTPEVFQTLDPEEQGLINEILFKISSEKIEPNQGISALEFILMSFIRITNKKVNGMSLTAEDQAVEDSLNRILAMHEITNETPKASWLFDYMAYAEYKSQEFLNNRKEHVERKKKTIGEV
jgi:hypothetical protein